METSKKVLNNLGKELKNDLGSISKLSKLFNKTYTNVNSWKALCKSCGFENMREAELLYKIAKDYKYFEQIMYLYPMQLDGQLVVKKRLFSTDFNNVVIYECKNKPADSEMVSGYVLKNNGFRLYDFGKTKSVFTIFSKRTVAVSSPNNKGGKDVFCFVKRGKDKPFTINDTVNALIEYAKAGFPTIDEIKHRLVLNSHIIEEKCAE